MLSLPDDIKLNSLWFSELTTDTTKNGNLREYRNQLINLLGKAEEAIDRSLLSLSGGALGISFAFISDIVNIKIAENKSYLFCSWVCWVVSIIATLVSMYLSPFALRKTIDQVDNGSINEQHPGGTYDHMIKVLNALGIISFLGGIIFVIIFVNKNI